VNRKWDEEIQLRKEIESLRGKIIIEFGRFDPMAFY
jgi:hypothetical protein